MKRTRIRHLVLVALVLLAAASMFPSLGGGSKPKPLRISSERARYEAAGRLHHPRVAESGRQQRTDTWAER
jgi:hypothetical protein